MSTSQVPLVVVFYLEPESSDGARCRCDSDLAQEEDEVTHAVDGRHAQHVGDENREGSPGRRTEVGALNGCRRGNKAVK